MVCTIKVTILIIVTSQFYMVNVTYPKHFVNFIYRKQFKITSFEFLSTQNNFETKNIQ